MAREWIEVRGWPTSVDRGIHEADGLLEAAEAAAAAVQATLYELDGPADLGWAMTLDFMRWRYLTPLKLIGGNALAKRIEREAAAGHPPRALRGWLKRQARRGGDQVGRRLEYALGRVPGCGCAFPDVSHGRGRRWPRWCPACARAKSNAADKATRDLEDRIRSVY